LKAFHTEIIEEMAVTDIFTGGALVLAFQIKGAVSIVIRITKRDGLPRQIFDIINTFSHVIYEHWTTHFLTI